MERHGWTREQANALKGRTELLKALTDAESGVEEGILKSLDNAQPAGLVQPSLGGDGHPICGLPPDGNPNWVSDFSTGDSTSDDEPELQVSVETVPEKTSPEWQAYVLSQFLPDEMVIGNPTVDGLRRVVTKLIGPIKRLTTAVHQCPTRENGGRAVVTCTVEILPFGADPYMEAQMCIDGSADVFEGNCDHYSHFPIAVAETRAEGRALRKILLLRKVLAAEETTVKSSEDAKALEFGAPTEKATSEQINFINLLCKKNNIDGWAFINSGETKYKRLNDMNFGAGQIVLRQLNESMQKEPKTDKPLFVIPDELRGYKDDFLKHWEE